MKLDILAIGAHPDDVELSCAGTLLAHMATGSQVGILDLTHGELGTRGSGELRLIEAANAAKALGIEVRENAGFADGFFQNDKEHQLALIRYIRKYQPDIILANAIHDRHPDHARAAKLVEDACFLSGLRKIETELDGKSQDSWRPRAIYHYIQSLDITPSFAIDITPYFEQKLASIRAYKSQFHDPESLEPATFISTSAFMEFVHGRAMHFGVPIGVQYAEAFTSKKLIGARDLNSIY